jgi:hypothetical protein
MNAKRSWGHPHGRAALQDAAGETYRHHHAKGASPTRGLQDAGARETYQRNHQDRDLRGSKVGPNACKVPFELVRALPGLPSELLRSILGLSLALLRQGLLGLVVVNEDASAR